MKVVEKKSGKNIFSGYQVKSKFKDAKVVLSSWKDGVHEVVSSKANDGGLRAPQFGALCAIRAHWTVSDKAATIVMPTGTGKSETILATIVTEKILRSLIVVPSDLLRTQIYEKAKSFGILYDIGMLDSNINPPNVFLYGQGIKNNEKFKESVLKSNVIVTTMAMASRMPEEYISYLSDNVDVLFVDEAHHISSKTWAKFKERFTNNKVLQFTATPFREDGKKIDGNIVYNFPLRIAQEQGYFKKIEFMPVEEFDEKKRDQSIAEKAIRILEKDIEGGHQHIVLVRASGVERAEELFNLIYEKLYKKYNPVLITNKQSTKEKRERIDNLKNYHSQIVVCVDMFGEGIDIPGLKIAAIHDKYKSMPITLQFIGRFARSKDGLGNAKLVTNIADEDISDALEELYDKDADWNKLLPRKSSEYIDREISLQHLITGFNTEVIEDLNLIHLRPKVSMVAFQTSDRNWNWKKWKEEFDSGQCKIFINEEEKILIVIEPREVGVRWTTQQNINNLEWNFYIVYWNTAKQTVFLNSSDISKGNKLIKRIFATEPMKVQSEQVFKSLYGIKRLMLGTVGLNSAIDGPIRYKMFAGVDVAEGISETNKINSYKSNIFGTGYNGDGKVSIGSSYKGTIWSHWVESIDYWKDWCNDILEKLTDSSIDVDDILKGVLIPEVIKNIPNKQPYRIDWPNELEFETERKVTISNISGEYDISNVDILLDYNDSSSEKIYFYIKNESFYERFVIEIKDEKYSISSKGEVTNEIQIGRRTIENLATYFMENPPTIWFVDGSSIQGNILVELKEKQITKFPSSAIYSWDWKAMEVNIKVESQLDKETYKKKEHSIQFNMIKWLKEKDTCSIIFDDDGSGEIADIVAITEKDNSIVIKLFHCKYSTSKNPGSRVGDLYEVCGQADKSVFWKQNPVKMLDRMVRRENKRIVASKPSRFEKGDRDLLKVIRNKLLSQPLEFQIIIVQPGVKASKVTDDMHKVLSTSHSYCLDTFSVPVQLICS